MRRMVLLSVLALAIPAIGRAQQKENLKEKSACCAPVTCVSGECADRGWACNEIGAEQNPSRPHVPQIKPGEIGCVEVVDIWGVTDSINDGVCVGGSFTGPGSACLCIGTICVSGPMPPGSFTQGAAACTAASVATCRAFGAAHCAKPPCAP